MGGKKKEAETSQLINERMNLKQSLKKAISNDEKERIENLIKNKESEMSSRMENENFKKVSEKFGSMTDTTGSLNTNGMWSLKKKIFPS